MRVAVELGMTEISEPKRPQLPEGWAWEWDDHSQLIEAVKRERGKITRFSYSLNGGRSNAQSSGNLSDDFELADVGRIVEGYGLELWPEDPPAFGVRSAIAKLRAERDWARRMAEVAKAEAEFRKALAEHVQTSEARFEVVNSLVRDEEIERAVAELVKGGWPARWVSLPTRAPFGGAWAGPGRMILPDGEE